MHYFRFATEDMKEQVRKTCTYIQIYLQQKPPFIFAKMKATLIVFVLFVMKIYFEMLALFVFWK